ncbi:MAG: hypothetical protein QOI89_3396 [Solirubrobacteraceae bacterium]|nr:hypothetical protein [Solirubrobacteraceae bacterium]
MLQPELRWIKAQQSIGVGACVELAVDGDLIALRNSKNPHLHCYFTHAEFAAFLVGAKKGEFDHLLEF